MRPICSCAVLAALALGGCGIGVKATPGGTTLRVTRDFGRRPVVRLDTPRVRSGDTVAQVVGHNTDVTLDPRWSVFINGVQPEKDAGAVKLQGSEAIWLDRHDKSAAPQIPAVVGDFPEPFLHGPDGKRLPTRLECTPLQTAECDAVQAQMTRNGVLAALGGVSQSFTKQTLRILVGPYERLRQDNAVRLLEEGPRASGVFARPTADGRTIALLDAAGAVVRTLGPGTGLIAATRYEDGQPVWAVTGTDEAGVRAAVAAFGAQALTGNFALAVGGGRRVALPVVR